MRADLTSTDDNTLAQQLLFLEVFAVTYDTDTYFLIHFVYTDVISHDENTCFRY